MTELVTPEEFMGQAPKALTGSSTWGMRYAATIRAVVHRHAAYQPRSLQKHLGPSELGTNCDRQVAGKMAGLPATNHVADPWPSVKGTAVHAWLAEAFVAENIRSGIIRYATEQKVMPNIPHPGTGDLYDAVEEAVIDHKILGPTTMDKLKRPQGPPRKYIVQLLLYGEGFANAGLPVKRIAVAAYPVASATLDSLYVWDHVLGETIPGLEVTDDQLLAEVAIATDRRYDWAQRLDAGQATLTDIPHTPDSDDCFFCPFYRPEAARDQGPGCPGTATPK